MPIDDDTPHRKALAQITALNHEVERLETEVRQLYKRIGQQEKTIQMLIADNESGPLFDTVREVAMRVDRDWRDA